MTGWVFEVAEIAVNPYAAAPELTARIRISATNRRPVHAIALRCQIKIEPQRRAYDDADAVGLRGIFGERDRWHETLRPLLWMQTSTMVQGFTDVTEVALPLPCTYDFDVTASRYFQALGDGAVPLTLMFNGTVFTKGDSGLAVEQLPWDAEARHDLPVPVWQELVRTHFPGTGWVRLEHETIRELEEFRSRHGLTSWEETVAQLLAESRGDLRAKGGTP